MKYLKRFLENKNYDEDYTIIAERTFYELDDKFRWDENQFFPLKVTLEEYQGNYDLTIALGGGWITRLSDEDINWMNEYVSELNQNPNLHASFMGDSSGRIGSKKLFFMKNDCFPESPIDYMNMPRGRYPDRG